MVAGHDNEHAQTEAVEERQKRPDLRVEAKEVIAHFRSLRAVAVTDEIRGRKAQCEQVSDASPPKTEVVDEYASRLHRVRIDEVHGPDVCPTRVFGRELGMPRPLAELIIRFKGRQESS